MAPLLAVVALAGCGADRSAVSDSPQAPARAAAAPGSTGDRPARQGDWLVDRAMESGLEFVYFNGMSGEYYFPEMLPGGVALVDYDNDGDLDVYFAQGRMLGAGKTIEQALIKAPLPLTGRLFRNDLRVDPDGTRHLHLTDVTSASGIVATGYGMGVAAGDFDNDGCVDLYLTNFGPNQMFRNNCDGTFTDVSRETGTGDAGWAVSAAFVDYDRDGWLDLYVGNYVQYDTASDRPCTGLTGQRDYCTPKVYPPQPDRLYHNDHGRRFVDVTATALRGGTFGPALGVSTADFNNDGWMDIYVANDGTENLLWINQRDGTFRNTALLSGAALSAEGKAEASMGVDAGDFDNDGDEDLFVTNLPVEGADLYVNDGHASFEDLSALSGLGPATLGYSGFGTGWFDIDNDGWLDLLAVNGAIEAIKGRQNDVFPYGERKLLFRNLRNGRFADATSEGGAVLSVSEVSRGAAFGDIDNDGDTDVIVTNLNGPARLLLNTIGSRQHWMGLRLLEAGTARASPASSTPAARARDALGARVEIVRRNGPVLWRRARSDGSYASANDARVLAGLGDSPERPTVRVHWPEGGVDEWRDVPIDTYSTLTRGAGQK